MKSTKLTFLVGLGLFAVFVAVLPGTVRADGTQLTLSSVSGVAGQDVTLFGTISNTGSDLVNLNGESFNLDTNFVNGDTTDFINNAPFFLSENTDSGLIALFTFEIAPGTAPGIYTGNLLQILGGPGGMDLNDIADASFTVDVKGKAVPEPNSLWMLGLGIVAISILRLKSNRGGTFAAS
jgi:PEP-CTERM motif-containing protein